MSESYSGPPSYPGGRPPAWLVPHGTAPGQPPGSWPPPGPWPPPVGWVPPAPWTQPVPWGAQPGWSAPPPRRERAGTLVAAAVLGYVSAVLVLVGTVWGLALGALLRLARQLPLGFGPVMTVLHLLLATLLVVGGSRALAGRRRWLLGALVLQLALVPWWHHALGNTSSLVGERLPKAPWLFAVLTLVALGLAAAPELRRWWSRAAARRSSGRRRTGG